MPDEKQTETQEEKDDSYFEGIRADLETAVYAYTAIIEIDLGLQDKVTQRSLGKAKDACVTIMCKALKILQESYDDE